MILVSFKEKWRPEGLPLIQNSDAVFQSDFNIENLVHPVCKKIVEFIDRSEVLYPGVIKSPVLGYIPPEKLSGGCKHVLLAWQGNYLHQSARMGENCVEPLLWVAKDKDIYLRCTTVFLGFFEQFDSGLFYSLEEGRVIQNPRDYAILQHKHDDTGFYNGEWDGEYDD